MVAKSDIVIVSCSPEQIRKVLIFPMFLSKFTQAFNKHNQCPNQEKSSTATVISVII